MKIRIEYYEHGLSELDSEVFDLDDDIYDVVLFFGNGVPEEAIVSVDSCESLESIKEILNSGGYGECDGAVEDSRLYRAGCLAYPESEPFVFVDPKPVPIS